MLIGLSLPHDYNGASRGAVLSFYLFEREHRQEWVSWFRNRLARNALTPWLIYTLALCAAGPAQIWSQKAH